MTWMCKITASTNKMCGKRRKISAMLDCAGDAKAAIIDHMLNTKNGWEWLGVEVKALSPLGQTFYVLVEIR